MSTQVKNPNILLATQVNELTKEISKLKNQEFMQVFARPWKFIWFSFLKGLMIGFGSVLGASVLVAIFIYVLAQIRLVPVLGDFVQDVIDQIQIRQEVQQKNLNTENFPQKTDSQPGSDQASGTSTSQNPNSEIPPKPNP